MKKTIKLGFAVASLSIAALILSSPVSGAVNISRSPNWMSWAPRIAVDSIGNIHVVWAEYYSDTRGDAFYAKYDILTQEWSTPLNLSGSSNVNSSELRSAGIDVDSLDNVYVVYQERGSVKLRIFSQGHWGQVIDVAGGFRGVDSPRVAVDSSGNIFISWWDTEVYAVYSRARVGGTWEGVRLVSRGRAKFSDIGVGNMKVFACWTSNEGAAPYQINYVQRNTTFDAPWSTPQLVKPSSHKQQVPAIDLDANDIAHVVYTPMFDEAFNRRVDYCYWTGNGFSYPKALSPAMFLHYPSLHARGNNVYVCWQLGAFGSGSAIHINTRMDGVWTGETSIPESKGCTLSDIGTSPAQDQVYVVWDGGGDIWCNMGQVGPVDINNKPPVADFSFSPSTGIFPLAVTFDASASHDPDGNIIQYSWSFGDGSTGTGQVATHVYTTWGTFAVRLTVRDNKSATASKVQQIEVSRLFQPLNIRWTSKRDESLFLARDVTQVTWDKNPANDSLGAVISFHRIFKKKAGDPDTNYLLIGEVSGTTYSFLDTKDISPDNVYTVTVRDSQGHESPIIQGQGGSDAFNIRRQPPASLRRGRPALVSRTG
jgi:PKD repeat protein